MSRDIRAEFATRKSPKEPRDFEAEIPETSYREGEFALARAVEFLQEDAAVPHFAFLPYRYLLVVLTRFFAHFPEPEPRNRLLLRRWFWRAALIGPSPFASSWTNAMDNLSNRIKAQDETGSTQRLLDYPINQSLPRPNLTGFRTNTAASRVALSALWALKPRSLVTGEPYERSQLGEAIPLNATVGVIAHRIFNREPKNHAAWVANRILILEEELPGAVADLLTAPLFQLDALDHAFLSSQCLDEKMLGLLCGHKKSDFLMERQHRIENVVKDFIETMAETHLEDTPPLDSFDLDDAEERDDALA